jgi:hypothetical protein
MIVSDKQGRIWKEVLSSDVAVRWLAFLFRIREVPGLNLGLETGYPDWDFCGFLQSRQANGIVHLNKPLPTM